MSSEPTPLAEASITVLYFAAASTTLGINEERVAIPAQGFYLASLPHLLVERHSSPNRGDRGEQLRKVLESSQWSVDAEMVDDADLKKTELKDGMEVAVICPVSGG